VVRAAPGRTRLAPSGAPRRDARWPPVLTSRERQILAFVRAGWEHEEIAMLLDLECAVVSRHLQRAQQVLLAETLDEAVAGALLWGLIR
jgi:DNA-binding NarL/FixJ family response regulator